MPVTTKHREYLNAFPRWKTVRDVVGGQERVKAAGTVYLPMPNPTNHSEENVQRYDQYKQRALFLEVTGRTRHGLVGAIFRRASTWELPESIAYLAEDVDGVGQSVEQLSKWVCGELLETGRVGLLADFTRIEDEGPRTLAQARSMNLRAVVLPYKTESIINWRYAKIDGRIGLSLLVLEEEINVSADPFEEELETRYRVLTIDEDGIYRQRVYNHRQELVEGPIEPRRGDGQPWRQIPFVVMGAENNQPGIDDSPLYGLAVVNIGHYRNSADYEEGVYIHGQGTMFIDPGLMSADDFHRSNPNGIQVGSRAGHVLGQGGNAQLLQFQANSAAREAMRDKEEQMVAIGARLITAKGSNQTAEEARINASGESSVLSNLTGNAAEGIEAALEFAAIFENVDPDDVRFSLNQDFFDVAYNPQESIAKMQELDRGIISKVDYRGWLRKVGHIAPDRTDEDIDDDVSNDGPKLGNIGLENVE